MAAITLHANELLAQSSQASLFPLDLEKMGVCYEKWEVRDVDLSGVDFKHPTAALIKEILCGNQGRVDQLYDFRTPEGEISLFSLSPEMDGLSDLLVKFDQVHDHAAPEIRLILKGEGIFNIYTPEKVKHEIRVQSGSFLVIPKEVAHNFTLTETRTITALRVFQDQEGWKARPRAEFSN